MSENKFRAHFKVPFDAIDFTGKIGLNGVCSNMQVIAADHASLLGFNYYKNCSMPQYYWILSRVKYVMDVYPEWEDEIDMETYPGGYEKLYAVRLFDIYRQGQKIGHIIGDYVLMDAEKMRPVRIKGGTGSLAFLDFPYEGEKLQKLKIPEGEVVREEVRKAFYSELDLNEHMNNAHYVRWAVDMLSVETLKHYEIGVFEINYNTSVTYGVEVKVKLIQEAEDCYVAYGNSMDDQINYFIARMTLRAQ